jgi:nicotinic acid phosphoribosyltransferase
MIHTLNGVMKLATADRWPAVKLNDDAGKNSGDKKTVAEIKRGFELTLQSKSP